MKPSSPELSDEGLVVKHLDNELPLDMEDPIPDSELAINWSFRKKAYNFLVPALIGFVM